MTTWTTIDDVVAAVVDAMGGSSALRSARIERSAVRSEAVQAWVDYGCGRYEQATKTDQERVIAGAIECLTAKDEA